MAEVQHAFIGCAAPRYICGDMIMPMDGGAMHRLTAERTSDGDYALFVIHYHSPTHGQRPYPQCIKPQRCASLTLPMVLCAMAAYTDYHGASPEVNASVRVGDDIIPANYRTIATQMGTPLPRNFSHNCG